MTKPRNNKFWLNHIAQWQETDLSQQQYCDKNNLKPHSFSYHKCKSLNNKNNDNSTSTKPLKEAIPSTGFIQLSPPQYISIPESLTLHFKDGLSLSGIELSNIDVVKKLTEVFS